MDLKRLSIIHLLEGIVMLFIAKLRITTRDLSSVFPSESWHVRVRAFKSVLHGVGYCIQTKKETIQQTEKSFPL